jgi:hypothetical protein
MHYPTQQAQLLRVLRFNGCRSLQLNRQARLVLASRSHWYVKQEVLKTLCAARVEPKTLREVWKIFDRGENADLRRAALLCLICSSPGRPLGFLSGLQREIDAKVLRTGRYLWSLARNTELIRRELTSMSQLQDDRFMVDKIYKWPLFAQSKDRQVRAEAKRVLAQWCKLARRSHLRLILKRFARLF